jgi:hypothetical protein
MPKALVLHHSTYGPIEAMAQAAVDLVQLHPTTALSLGERHICWI